MPDSDLNVRKRIYKAELGAYLLIVTLAIIGFWSQGNQQDALARSQTCTEQYLSATVNALNQRTQYTLQQADANVELQRAQAAFIKVLLSPHSSDQARSDGLSNYFDALTEFNRLVALGAGKANQFPYPRAEDYRACLRGGK